MCNSYVTMASARQACFAIILASVSPPGSATTLLSDYRQQTLHVADWPRATSDWAVGVVPYAIHDDHGTEPLVAVEQLAQ